MATGCSQDSDFPQTREDWRDWGGGRSWLSERGIEVAVDYTGEGLANIAGGRDRGAVYEGLIRADLDVELEKWNLARGGFLHLSGLYPHGPSLSERYVGDLFTLSNIDAPDEVRLFEFWWEQHFLDDQLSFRVGQLAADEEFAATAYGCLFMNGTCGWPAVIALNVPAPAYPMGALGARVAYEPDDPFTLRVAVYDGDPDEIGSDGSSDNPHGVAWSLDEGALIIGEIEWRWGGHASGQTLPGAVKLGGWYHTGDFEDLRWDDGGVSLADPEGSGIPALRGHNWGGYMAGEQQVWQAAEPGEPGEGLGVFARAGLAPGDRSLVGAYAEGGIHYQGLIPGRGADRCGMAMVCGWLGEGTRGLARDQEWFSGMDEPLPDFEWVLELEYRFQLLPWWSLQPGVHWMVHPGGSSATEDAWVASLRSQVSF